MNILNELLEDLCDELNKNYPNSKFIFYPDTPEEWPAIYLQSPAKHFNRPGTLIMWIIGCASPIIRICRLIAKSDYDLDIEIRDPEYFTKITNCLNSHFARPNPSPAPAPLV